MNKFIFLLVIFFSPQLLSHGPIVIGQDGWKQVPPQEVNVSVFDPILNLSEPIGYKGHGNVGAGVDGGERCGGEEGEAEDGQEEAGSGRRSSGGALG